jgi:hypothetical protein
MERVAPSDVACVFPALLQRLRAAAATAKN